MSKLLFLYVDIISFYGLWMPPVFTNHEQLMTYPPMKIMSIDEEFVAGPSSSTDNAPIELEDEDIEAQNLPQRGNVANDSPDWLPVTSS